jgi:hypothetical protein
LTPALQGEGHAQRALGSTALPPAAEAAVVTAEAARGALYPEGPRPGEPFVAAFALPYSAELRAGLYNSEGTRVSMAALFELGALKSGVPVIAAILAVPSTCKPGDAVVKLLASKAKDAAVIMELPTLIPEREFRSEELKLSPSNAALLSEPDPEKTAQTEQLWAIRAVTGSQIYHDGPFQTPVPPDTRRTSRFGTRRVNVYPNGGKTTSIHAGIDFGVPRGTQVAACANGIVRLAMNRIVTGNTVIIEHAPGVYSEYYHMNKVLVKPGSAVRAGDIVGESGSTGFSTGPHLHWEIRVASENTDPDAFVSRALLDKTVILAILEH